MIEKHLHNNTKPSYASAVVTKVLGKAPEKVLCIHVKAKNNNNHQTLDDVKKKITNDLAIPINNVKKNNNGLVSVTCKNSIDVTRVKSVLSEKLGSEYYVEMKHLKLPKIKVINIENDLEKADLCEDIFNRNFLEIDGAFDIFADYRNAIGKCTLTLQVTPESYQHLKDNGFNLYIGHQSCHVFDHFNFTLCFKCGQANHNHKKCNNIEKCLYCAG